MGRTVKIPDPVYERAEKLKEEDDFATLGDAIRHMCREGGFDV